MNLELRQEPITDDDYAALFEEAMDLVRAMELAASYLDTDTEAWAVLTKALKVWNDLE